MIASSKSCTPLFFNAEPVNTGTSLLSMVATRNAARNSSSDISSPPKYFSMSASSVSTILSTSTARNASVFSFKSAGISSSTMVSPLFPLNRIACIVIRSTTPSKLASAPIGYCSATALVVNRSWIVRNEWSKLAPVRSILLMKHMRGTRYLSA